MCMFLVKINARLQIYSEMQTFSTLSMLTTQSARKSPDAINLRTRGARGNATNSFVGACAHAWPSRQLNCKDNIICCNLDVLEIITTFNFISKFLKNSFNAREQKQKLPRLISASWFFYYAKLFVRQLSSESNWSYPNGYPKGISGCTGLLPLYGKLIKGWLCVAWR
jgi:hypothetical protein